MKLLAAFLFTVVFIALLLGIYVIHVWYFPVPVVLYSALLDAFIAVAIAGVILLAVGRRGPLGGFERVLLLVVWMLGGYAFAISGPTVLDRSLSFYLLEKLEQRGGGIREEAFADVFINEYMDEFRLVDVRLTEQLQSGTIAIEDGCVRLTPRGRMLAGVSRFVRLNLLPRQRLLAGELTDDLVDPFAGSPAGRMGYEC